MTTTLRQEHRKPLSILSSCVAVFFGQNEQIFVLLRARGEAGCADPMRESQPRVHYLSVTQQVLCGILRCIPVVVGAITAAAAAAGGGRRLFPPRFRDILRVSLLR